MTNTSNQLIDSVRALLREAILPELQSDIARARLRQIMATLRDVDWDEAPLTVLRENRQLQALAAQLAGSSAAGPGVDADVPAFESAFALNQSLRREVASLLPAAPGTTWTPLHADAARVLADCAHQRARKRHAPSRD